MNLPRTIILSRPDALGDAVVTLPMAGLIKRLAPDTRIVAVVKQYTRPLWEQCTHVHAIVTLEELQAGDPVDLLRAFEADALVHVFPHRDVATGGRQAGIPQRIGTSHRWWHWISCNERVSFSRRKSDLHEAQLNIKLLAPFGIDVPTTDVLSSLSGLRRPAVPASVTSLLRFDRRRVILHPLLGSGVGWGLHNHAAVIRSLDPQQWQVIVTGTAAEAERYRGELPLDLPHVVDAGGRLSLTELMALIGSCDALVAASTGPLHISAALGIRAIGLFSMRRPIHPGRWAPLGPDAHALVNDKNCPACASGEPCDCITRIEPRRVLSLLEELR
ncbi:MAG: glycosyltransferase family 9 protein [Flavobacteriales bacterium]|nr:glycosyltransferase family 9 protein [Flavobacteriales bacterium]